jgi:pimeloyl-[acyl-carrier protein] methyl ester esterase
MSKRTMVLLPGFNGTSELFKNFIKEKPENITCIPIVYPDAIYNYEELSDYLVGELQSISTPFVLLGESFAGPLAILLAEKLGSKVSHLILVATFVTSPKPRVFYYLPWGSIFHLARPVYKVAEKILSEFSKTQILADVFTELLRVDPSIHAARLRDIFRVDVSENLRQLTLPILYIRATQDLTVCKKSLREVQMLQPNIVIEEVSAPHMVLQIQPEKAWQAIFRFIPNAK